MREFFLLNQSLILFLYGLTYFVMGLAIFLQSRRYSRLRLARDLQWLAAFGVLHGIHEWGSMFIPIQSVYVPAVYIHLLLTFQTILVALSFLCLLMFGAVTLERPYPWLKPLVVALGAIWGLGFWVTFYTTPTVENWHLLTNIWARYLLGLTGGLLAAYGLRYQAQTYVAPLNTPHIYRALRIAGIALVTYAFLGGLIVPQAGFFPANVLNQQWVASGAGVPVEVFRSIAGLVLALAIIRALEIFDIELDRLIEQMEVERIQAAERERIGQEIHDGAIQAVYSASLILESTEPLVPDGSEAARRLWQARSVLNAATMDLRSYMVALRAESPTDPLITSLQQLINDPRFRELLDIELVYDYEPTIKPMQVHHILAIVQESLSNTIRHGRARAATITILRGNDALILRIEDNGRGFSLDTVQAGYGLRSMRDRAHLMGGHLEISSTPGKGTKTILTLPEEKV